MNTFDLEVFETTPRFVYGRLDHETTHQIMEEVALAFSEINLVASEIGMSENKGQFDNLRKASQAWLQDTPQASYVLQKLAFDVNDTLWNYTDLDPVYPSIQYTLYKDLSDHYDWHQDQYDLPDEIGELYRKISISLCLSHDDMYEGAEFCIKDGSNSNVRYFKMKYGDFIVFPSNVEHRVNALRSGERLSLVNWYGTLQKQSPIEA